MGVASRWLWCEAEVVVRTLQTGPNTCPLFFQFERRIFGVSAENMGRTNVSQRGNKAGDMRRNEVYVYTGPGIKLPPHSEIFSHAHSWSLSVSGFVGLTFGRQATHKQRTPLTHSAHDSLLGNVKSKAPRPYENRHSQNENPPRNR